MSFDPFKESLDPEFRTLVDLAQDGFYQILVFHWFLVRSQPIIASPFLKPDRNTVNRILAVCDNCHISMSRGNVKGTQDRCELGALICLTTAFEGF